MHLIIFYHFIDELNGKKLKLFQKLPPHLHHHYQKTVPMDHSLLQAPGLCPFPFSFAQSALLNLISDLIEF